MPYLSNKALHFPTLHISDPTHECMCLSLKLHTSHCLHFTTRVKWAMHYTFQHCISLTPHMSVCVCLSLSQTSYISITTFHYKSGRGPCVTPTFAHFCIILSIVFLHFPIVFYNILKGHRSLLDDNLWSVLKGP